MKKVSILLSVVMVMALAMAGCATSGGTKAADVVSKQADTFVKAVQAKKIDDAMKLFSESFKHYEWGNKAGAKGFLTNALDMGYLDNLKSNMANMKVTVEGAKATAYPIELSGSFGTVTLELTFANEAGNWLISQLDASGI